MNGDWWKGAVIYQIYPRSYLDTNGDGIGDLPGITRKLPYIADLGVDAIWISPFFRSPMVDFGYDVSDYRDIDPLFGSLEDFDRLLARAHELGLKVIVDLVFSHTSEEHAWFRESRERRDNPKADWYVWADARADGTPPNNWQSIFGGPAWTWDSRRRQYYLHHFYRQQPDLNGHEPEVQEALLDIARYWLDRGVDGFRFDAVSMLMHDPELRDNPAAPSSDGPPPRPYAFQLPEHSEQHETTGPLLARIRSVLDEYEATFSVAEVGGEESLDAMGRFGDGETTLHTSYNFAFLNAPGRDGHYVRQMLERWDEVAGEAWPSWTFSNHDAPRVRTRWAEGVEDGDRLARVLNALLLSLRGTLFLYQGEELGLPQAHVPFERLVDPEAIANWPNTWGRDGARTPMPWASDAAQAGFSTVEPWLPVDPAHCELAVDLQQAAPDSTLAVTRRLIRLRRSSPALRAGTLRFLGDDPAVLAFVREAADDRVLCAFNLTTEPQALQLDDELSWQALADLGLGGEIEEGFLRLPPIDGVIARA